MVCCELFLTHSEKSQNIELRRKYNAECSKTDGQTPPSYCKTKKKVNGNLPSKQLICSSRTSGRCLAWSLAIMVSTLLLFATIWNPCLFVSICFRSVCGYVAAMSHECHTRPKPGPGPNPARKDGDHWVP
jgi:hypothetical protein